MIIFLSGLATEGHRPEQVLKKANIMLTYWEIHDNHDKRTARRLLTTKLKREARRKKDK